MRSLLKECPGPYKGNTVLSGFKGEVRGAIIIYRGVNI